MDAIQTQLAEATHALELARGQIMQLEAQQARYQALLDSQGIVPSSEHLRDNRLASILETLNDALISVTLPDHQIDYISPNFEQVIGYSYARFSDPEFYKTIIHPDDQEAAIKARKKATLDGISDYLHRIVTPDGRTRWLRRHSTATFNAQHQVIRVDELIRDVTAFVEANQKLVQSEAKFANIFGISPDGVMISRALDGLVIDVNEAYLRMYGYRREELIGQNAYTLGLMANPDQLGTIKDLIVSQGHISDFEIDYRIKSGEIRTELLSAVLTEIDGHSCVISFVKDITERKQAELREQAAAQKLRAVLEAVNTLLKIDDHDTFFRRVVELCLEKLAIERCGLLMIDPVSGLLYGAYGTDDQRRITDEHDFQYQITAAEEGMFEDFQANQQQWALLPDSMMGFWDGQNRQKLGHGWLAVTPILNKGKPIAVLSNDTAISGAPVDPFQQEQLALFASLVGQIWERKQSEQLLRERDQAQQALAEERNLLRSVIDAVPDFIYVKDKHNRMLVSNIAHTQFMGKADPADLIGKTDYDFLPPHISVSAAADEDAVLRTGVSRVDIEEDVNGVNPHFSWVSTTKTPLRNLKGEIVGLVGITRDIGARKAAEQALRLNEAALERELAQEKELGELRERFVSTTSHEFRTPLATIMAATESLEAYRSRMTEDQIVQRLAKILNQGKRLKGIIDEVLLLSRMQSGRVAFEPSQIDLDTFCQDVISDFENRPDITHQIRYTCTPQSLMAWIDGKLLQPALSNLIGNAIKYSPAGEFVYMTVKADSESLTIQIRDTGIGIPADELSHLFESFHRASNVGDIQGTGLGLVITKQSVELHGGSIQVASVIGEGTTFTIWLPIITGERPV